ncbi:MAG: DUF3854 domain-containing protein [Thermomicrobiales bacterium]
MTSMNGEKLSAEHRHQLEVLSRISPGIITRRGYESFVNTKGLPQEVRGRFPNVSGLFIPIWDTQGEVRTGQYKPDHLEPNPKTGKVPKYLNPRGGETCLDVPAAALPFLYDVETDLWITEGAKKVDSAVSHGIPCIVGLLGVAMWQREGMALPDWKDIALKGRRVVIAFDSDVMTNPRVRTQLVGLANFLTYRGARVRYCLLPGWEGKPNP